MILRDYPLEVIRPRRHESAYVGITEKTPKGVFVGDSIVPMYLNIESEPLNSDIARSGDEVFNNLMNLHKNDVHAVIFEINANIRTLTRRLVALHNDNSSIGACCDVELELHSYEDALIKAEDKFGLGSVSPS